MYRGQSGMWSWIFHRVTGVAILLFLLIHIVDITILGFGRDVYNHALTIFSTPAIRIFSLALIASVIYHSFNGVRITLIDFWPNGAKYQSQMWAVVMVVTILGVAGMGYFVLLPIFQGCPNHLCGN